MGVALAAMTGSMGRPGGGFGSGYGAIHSVGLQPDRHRITALAQGPNAVTVRMPVARIADVLLEPGREIDYNGRRIDVPRRPPRLLVRRQPVPPPPGPEPPRARLAAARDRDRARVVVEPRRALRRHRLPRGDGARAQRRGRRLGRLVDLGDAPGGRPAGRRCAPTTRRSARWPSGSASSTSSPRAATATSGCATSTSRRARTCAARASSCRSTRSSGPPGASRCRRRRCRRALDFAALRADPAGVAAAHAVGPHRARLVDDRGLRLRRLSGPPGLDGARRVARIGARASRFPLHLISNQPYTRLHSQYDNGGYSQDSKVGGREPIRLHPDDARARGIAEGDVVRVFNDRGSCLAGAVLDANLRRSVVQLSTGAWWDPVAPGDPSGARPPRQPERAHARQGHLAPRAGARSRRPRSSSSSATTGPLPDGAGVHPARADLAPAVRVELAYGSDGLTVELPDERTTVVEPLHPPAARRRARSRCSRRCATRSPGRRCARSCAAGQHGRDQHLRRHAAAAARHRRAGAARGARGARAPRGRRRARRDRHAPRQHRRRAARDARRRGAGGGARRQPRRARRRRR